MTVVAVLIAASVLGIGLLAMVVRRRFVVVTVYGPSMAPTLRDRDRLLVRRVRAARLRQGQVVVVGRPDGESGQPGDDRWIVKRVAAVAGDPVPTLASLAGHHGSMVPPGKLVLLGDNELASSDSRTHGYYTAGRVLGVAVRRLPRAPGTAYLMHARSG